jgi:CHASE2 domain-containing sensor protein
MKTLGRNIIITILAFVLVSSFALIALKLPFMGPIAEAIKEFEMTDVYCQILQDTNDDDEEVSDDITIVDMSELYSRRDLAKALVDIEKQNPKVIGVDIVFEGLKEDSVGDEMLTRIALENTNIVFSYKLLDYVNDSIGHADTVHSFFVDESDSINEGYTNMPRNLYGGIKRKLSLGEKVEGRLMPSFITKVSAMYEGRQVKDVSKKTININYIPKRFRVVEADSISVHPEWIKDKLVLFGAMKDEYDMHYTPLGKMAGVELLGYSIETLLQKTEVEEVCGWLMIAISFLLVLLTQVVFSLYTSFARKRKNRVARFLMSATFMRSYLMFIWIALWMWVAFILFYLYDIWLDLGWALSAIAFLLLAQSIYDEIRDAIKTKES